MRPWHKAGDSGFLGPRLLGAKAYTTCYSGVDNLYFSLVETRQLFLTLFF